jgi:DNA-binding NarL/FixJ family response regulator
MKRRALIADDHGFLCEVLKVLLSKDFDSVEIAFDGIAALNSMAQNPADLLLVDVCMPRMGGFEVARIVRDRWPETKIVMLTYLSDRDVVRAARELGLDGFVHKSVGMESLRTALATVMTGEQVFIEADPQVQLVTGLESKPSGVPLTTRQIQVLRLIAEGRSGKEIAHSLEISPKTVEFHKASISAQLGLHSTAELVRYAIEHKLLEATESSN